MTSCRTPRGRIGCSSWKRRRGRRRRRRRSSRGAQSSEEDLKLSSAPGVVPRRACGKKKEKVSYEGGGLSVAPSQGRAGQEKINFKKGAEEGKGISTKAGFSFFQLRTVPYAGWAGFTSTPQRRTKITLDQVNRDSVEEAENTSRSSANKSESLYLIH